MGFDIPEPFVWDESFKVFYETLDEEHRQLFKAVFEVAKDPSSADSLKSLVTVTEKHFTDEEEMMSTAKYEHIDPHKSAHAEFLGKIKKLSAPVDEKTVSYAKDWLVNHIKVTDFKYKEKL